MARVRNEFYLGGEWKEGKESAEVRNPWNDEVVGTVSLAGEVDAEEALKRALLGSRETRSLSSGERFDILS